MNKIMNIKKHFSKIISFIKKSVFIMVPTIEALKWASVFIYAFAFVIVVYGAMDLFKPIGIFYTFIIVLSVFILIILSGLLVNFVLFLLKKVPNFFRVPVISLLIICTLFFYINFNVFIISYLFLLFTLIITAVSLFSLVRHKSRGRFILGWMFFIIGIALLVSWAYWLLHPGSVVEYPEIALLMTDHRPETIQLDNPSQPGNFIVRNITYGSGKDRHRPEYGKEAGIITGPVDGSKLLGSWVGLAGRMRTRYFGFGPSELPLNGRVWYPEGDGPFPLVLIVHGNHLAQRFSDPGYAYLGEHLASRGMIMVSVDQNFLNSSITNIFSGLRNENDARGWLLLEHLRQWELWGNDPESIFFNKVDMDKISLMGHSRGGEAVSHAALFNRLPLYPDDGSLVFDYNFNIVSLIAIAPCDGQYQPSTVRTSLKDINYLALHGSHDADVTSFDGMRQLERIEFSKGFDGFSAGIYILGANHGQFNTLWGKYDMPVPYINFYNVRQLIKGEQQRNIAKVFITAFLEATLMNRKEYIPLFKDYRSAPNGWLYETVYVQQYRRHGMFPVCSFEEDFDLKTATVPGGRISANNLTDWYERRVRLKWSSIDSKAVYLGWRNNDVAPASYCIYLPSDYRTSKNLYMFVADSGTRPSDHKNGENIKNAEDADFKNDNDKPTAEEKVIKYIDFSIVLTDSQENRIKLSAADFFPLQPRLEARLGKHERIDTAPPGESIFQLMIFNLKCPSIYTEDFDVETVASIEIIFDKTSEGLIIISEIGFM